MHYGFIIVEDHTVMLNNACIDFIKTLFYSCCWKRREFHTLFLLNFSLKEVTSIYYVYIIQATTIVFFENHGHWQWLIIVCFYVCFVSFFYCISMGPLLRGLLMGVCLWNGKILDVVTFAVFSTTLRYSIDIFILNYFIDWNIFLWNV